MDTHQQETPGALTFVLLRLLADGEFHSGEALARQLGISRSGVNNMLRGVNGYGLTLYRVRGRGYCLANPPQWLDAARIGKHLGAHGKNFQVKIVDSSPSSNTLLLQQAALGAPTGSVLAVEWQSGGRGRMGRTWHSGLGNALTFSLLWRFECGLSSLSGLSLAVGIALMRALRALGIESAHLKWPNDVLCVHGKLAGILVEAQGDMLGPSVVVIGIGLNLSLPQPVRRQIEQPVASLADVTATVPERNLLFAVLLRELHGVLHEFGTHGFSALRAEWEGYHGMQGQPVQLLLPTGNSVAGTVRGVAMDGSLELDTAQGQMKFNVGEVSLRGRS
ncbi:MAG: biotin--[acetyl-CoA-carboxylase] ligase [Gallionellaceae bacterium]|nr:biotin--[acetyl-CoA-carboxylase] ligase [Gallionellaceae bacterium]